MRRHASSGRGSAIFPPRGAAGAMGGRPSDDRRHPLEGPDASGQTCPRGSVRARCSAGDLPSGGRDRDIAMTGGSWIRLRAYGAAGKRGRGADGDQGCTARSRIPWANRAPDAPCPAPARPRKAVHGSVPTAVTSACFRSRLTIGQLGTRRNAPRPSPIATRSAGPGSRTAPAPPARSARAGRPRPLDEEPAPRGPPGGVRTRSAALPPTARGKAAAEPAPAGPRPRRRPAAALRRHPRRPHSRLGAQARGHPFPTRDHGSPPPNPGSPMTTSPGARRPPAAGEKDAPRKGLRWLRSARPPSRSSPPGCGCAPPASGTAS